MGTGISFDKRNTPCHIAVYVKILGIVWEDRKLAERIVFMGPGAVGSYVGAYLVKSGEDVTFIDMWPEHVETMRRQGLRASGSQGDFTVPVNAMHLTDAQNITEPFDYAFVTMKSYDTEWATHFIKRYVKPEGCFISLQNCWNDPTIAGIVGEDRGAGLHRLSHRGSPVGARPRHPGRRAGARPRARRFPGGRVRRPG